jgi:hypothetical protein
MAHAAPSIADLEAAVQRSIAETAAWLRGAGVEELGRAITLHALASLAEIDPALSALSALRAAEALAPFNPSMEA